MSEHEHDYRQMTGSGYYKIDGNGRPDQSISYAMLYCVKCGETKEVVNAIH